MMSGSSHYHHQHQHLNGFGDDASASRSSNGGYAVIPASSSAFSSSPSRSHSPVSCSGANYIEHRVSKKDTLAGIAIKYGVEVADIRRMNGLVTDLQMFALQTLKIPLPGRHPPSPVLSNGSTMNGEQTPPRRPHDDVLNSLQSLKMKPPRKVSPAMSSLRGYYGLTPPNRFSLGEGTEMTVYKSGRNVSMDGTPHSQATDQGLSPHRKSRSLVSLINAANTDDKLIGSEGEENGEADKSIRRRQKADDNSAQTPEIIMKDDGGGGPFGRVGSGLALRPNVISRTEGDGPKHNSSIGDFFADFVSVRKSSSTSNLQESENGLPKWQTGKWSDAIPLPMFDGLPKPMTVRKKAALD